MNHRGFTHLVALATITVIAIAMIGVMAWFRNEANELPTNTATSNTNQTVTNTTTNTNSSTAEKKEYSLFAVKQGTHVTVNQMNLSDAATSVLFEYDEAREADYSGNTWKGLPPSITMSDDGTELAYISNQGLYRYNFESGEHTVIIRQLTNPDPNTEKAPTWSTDELGAYTLAAPKISFDNKYVIFTQSLYEGAVYGLINITSGNYTKVTSSSGFTGGGIKAVWSPIANMLLVPGAGGYGTPGLYVSNTNDVETVTKISTAIGNDSYEYHEAVFSPDAQRIAFIYTEANETERRLGIASSDGGNFRAIADSVDATAVTFSSDGKNVFFVKPDSSGVGLFTYSISLNTLEKVISLPNEYSNWVNPTIEEDILTLVGRDTMLGYFTAGEKTGVVKINSDSGAIVYQSEILPGFTTLIGFINK